MKKAGLNGNDAAAARFSIYKNIIILHMCRCFMLFRGVGMNFNENLTNQENHHFFSKIINKFLITIHKIKTSVYNMIWYEEVIYYLRFLAKKA